MAEIGAVDVERMEVYVFDTMRAKVEETVNSLENSIRAMQLAGMADDAIKAVILADLQGGGIIFGTYRNDLKNVVKKAVQMASTDGSMAKYQATKVKMWRWLVVSENPCPDCIPRHSRVEAMAHWRDVGLPGSGFSICGAHCKCRLVPTTYKGKDLENPVIREKRKKK